MDELARFFDCTVALDMFYKPAKFCSLSVFCSEDMGKKTIFGLCFWANLA